MWCFERLGLDSQATKPQIKKAFFRLARETHPDMVQDVSRKEAAAASFREIYRAYEAALEYRETGRVQTETTESSDENKDTCKSHSPRSNEFIRKAFQDVCDELAKETSEQIEKGKAKLRLLLQETWSNGDGASACWDLAMNELSHTISDSVGVFRSSNDTSLIKLGDYLEDQLRLRSQRRIENLKLEDQAKANFVMENWSDQDKIRDYAATWMLFHFDDVISLISDRAMKDGLRQLKTERMNEHEKKKKLRYKELARKIEDAYPNRSEMKKLLGSVVSWERSDVMELLSPKVRKLIMLG